MLKLLYFVEIPSAIIRCSGTIRRYFQLSPISQKIKLTGTFKHIFENSSPKGSFGRNKRKFEFSVLSRDSRKIESDALKFNSEKCEVMRIMHKQDKSAHPY